MIADEYLSKYSSSIRRGFLNHSDLEKILPLFKTGKYRMLLFVSD